MTNSAALIAFHTSRINAADAAIRAALNVLDIDAANTWAAVKNHHELAARTGSRADSDRAEDLHREANRTTAVKG